LKPLDYRDSITWMPGLDSVTTFFIEQLEYMTYSISVL